MKVVMSNWGGEYYEKHSEMGQCLGPFAKLLEKYSINTQYTMPYTPQ